MIDTSRHSGTLPSRRPAPRGAFRKSEAEPYPEGSASLRFRARVQGAGFRGRVPGLGLASRSFDRRRIGPSLRPALANPPVSNRFGPTWLRFETTRANLDPCDAPIRCVAPSRSRDPSRWCVPGRRRSRAWSAFRSRSKCGCRHSCRGSTSSGCPRPPCARARRGSAARSPPRACPSRIGA